MAQNNACGYLYPVYRKKYTEEGRLLMLRRWRWATCRRNRKAGGRRALIL